MTIEERNLIKAFYKHELDLSVATAESKELASSLLTMLGNSKCSEFMSVIMEDFTPFTIDKKDIPQFSSIDDCFDVVPNLLVNCGIDGVSYDKMGYMLRESKRKLAQIAAVQTLFVKDCYEKLVFWGKSLRFLPQIS